MKTLFLSALICVWCLPADAAIVCQTSGGTTVQSADWDTVNIRVKPRPVNGTFVTVETKYRIHLNGEWTIVPPAVIAAPGDSAQAMIWTSKDASGHTQIQCFVPGKR